MPSFRGHGHCSESSASPPASTASCPVADSEVLLQLQPAMGGQDSCWVQESEPSPIVWVV